MEESDDQQEEAATMLEFLAMQIRKGEPILIAVQAIYQSEDGLQIYASERTGAPIDKIQLMGLMTTRQAALAAALNGAGSE
jgi:hypothetical protein